MNAETDHKTRVALVTGATGAIGPAIAAGLAARPYFEVVLVARDAARAQRAVVEIVGRTGNERVRYELADLSRRTEIQALVARWSDPLHVLVNNAAASPRDRQETPEGIELQLATNVLGYNWMIEAFTPHLERAAPARVVNVASYYAGDLDLDDLEFRTRRYNNRQAYRQSKQANRMLTVAYAERLQAKGISVNSCHPGDVNSKLSNDLGFGGHETPEAGARTPVFLATDPQGVEVTGRYFEGQRAARCRFSEDRDAVERLYTRCQGYAEKRV